MIEISLQDRLALVCGSTQGIGNAVATELARAGATVILAARSEESLKQAVAALPADYGQTHDYVVADFSRSDEARTALHNYYDVQGQPPVHILVNNSGGPPAGPITDASAEAFTAALSQHLLMNHALVQMLLGGMKSSGYGRIINIISTSVKQPLPNLGVSNTTRGAVASWAKTLSFEVAKHGVTVNNILPGYVRTSRLESLIGGIAQAQKKSTSDVERDMLATIPAGRFGESSELGTLAAFLCSPLAAYITGTSIAVDGGRTTAL
jgi:3-oxoacyl-[acyl-carrier protein] reductase